MHVAVVGAGYVGLVTSACLAELGHQVVCLEVDERRLRELQRGSLPIYEPGLDELVQRGVRAGRLRFKGTFPAAVSGARFVFIAVPTPPLEDGRANTTHVFSAVREVLGMAEPGTIIVVKSTVPVGTGESLAHLARALGRVDVRVVSNPEFLRQGSAVDDFLSPDRIVVGAEDEMAGEAVAALYRGLTAPLMTCDRRSAELAKYAANALLATRISFMNEVAAVCEATGADVDEVARIVGADERIGPHFLRAGLGWGGSCFPKDVLALAATAATHGADVPILDAVFAVNLRQRDVALNHLLHAVSDRDDPVVAVLGLSFKPNTDDLRGSPALEVIGRLLENGVRVRAHDPVAMSRARAAMPAVEYGSDAYEVADGADALLLATEWPEYVRLDWARVRELMRGTSIVDGRNVLDQRLLRRLGFIYVSFGRNAAAHRRTIATVPVDGGDEASELAPLPVAESAA